MYIAIFCAFGLVSRFCEILIYFAVAAAAAAVVGQGVTWFSDPVKRCTQAGAFLFGL
jgi:hypothetical protein